jgi:Brp/Blh family beta-carotene 15,15'-monooxygenase
LQSFYGWKIETENPVFNQNEFVMMDFSIPQNGSTQFVYVLPYSDKTALVECTRFGREMIGQDEAEAILNQYITPRWGDYKITETETGVIPMSSTGFESKTSEENWILTGGRAGNIKPSTGYSFFKSCKDAERLSHSEKPLTAPGRFAFYDRLLLHILGSSPEKGKVIFERLFTNISAKTVLDFLREDVKPGKEVQILGSLPKGIFIKTAFLDFLNKLLNPVFIPLSMALLLLLLNFSGLELIGSAILLLGLLLLGLPHGAIDHLLETGKLNTPVQPAFIVKYLSLAAGMGFVWWLSPWLGLMVFLAYSAWHFGETEMQSSGKKNNLLAVFWGLCLLGFLLLSHPAELRLILAEMGLESIALPPESIQWVAFSGLLILGWLRGMVIFTASFYLLLAIKLPLLQAFGVYFIFDHSVKSSQQLLLGFNSHWKKLYPKALPFSAGAILLGLLFYSFNVWNVEGGTGLFFIFLSCLSFPHVIAMSGFYKIK